MRPAPVAVLAACALLFAGCGQDEGAGTGAARPAEPASSTTATPPATAPSEVDELPALPSGDVEVAGEAEAAALCERYKREPRKTGGRRQVTLRYAGGAEGLVCLLPR